MEEAKQAPEEEEEAEVEPSAPKKRKVGEVVSEYNKFLIRLTECFYRRWYLPATNASGEEMIVTRKRADPAV